MASHKKYATLLNKRGRDGLPTLPDKVDIPQEHTILWGVTIRDGEEYYFGVLLTAEPEIFLGRNLVEARSAVLNFERGAQFRG